MVTSRTTTPHASRVTSSHLMPFLALLVYVLLIMYGSLYPMSGWHTPEQSLWSLLSGPWPRYISRSDILVNVVVYIPVGALLTWWLHRRLPLLLAIFLATLGGIALSIGMEYLQTYLPSRVASKLDVWVNGAGSLIGAVAAWLISLFTRPDSRLFKLRHSWFLPGRLVDVGLAVLALWASFQAGALFLSIDFGHMRHALPLVWESVKHANDFSFMESGIKSTTYALDIIAFGLLTVLMARSHRACLITFVTFVVTIAMLKVLFMATPFALETLIGPAAGITLLLLLHRRNRITLAYAAAAALLVSFFSLELASGSGMGSGVQPSLYPMNWIPFRGQMNSFTGILDILASIKPFLALGCIASLVARPYLRPQIMLFGSLFIFALAFALEWAQQGVPGRHADITDALLALGGWLLPWHWQLQSQENTDKNTAATLSSPPHTDKPALRKQGVLAVTIALFTITILAMGATWWWQSSPFAEERLKKGDRPRLPLAAELPPVSLPDFRYAHPRLPAPGPADIHRLTTENPDFLRQQRNRAKNGNGDLEAAIVMARIEPGSQDLTVLHQRLMALKYTWRGHEQAKPIAMAYDWLHDQWSDTQRAELRDKLAEGCEYLIKLIREDRLSPYNVYLYNSPFQALIAATLALYGDSPRGDMAMRFTYDLWKNRVLPVWRQVMGKHGGWHEGGEYVGIGIGQAIYQVPAMWRKATGEDLFASEPGIRGFLNFALYRTRPDGTHFRWGDAGFFDKHIPDLVPLAMEYQHAAAYSLRRPPALPTPTSWPWGPLSTTTLYDPSALARLPLNHFFDGIGQWILRSDWSPTATYVTFKAGDNFWSHSHLDQGAFTIYKGGELAIDSGLYGPKYGSDHHMNYTYQTIAHNTITVTDPEDTVSAPGKKEDRPIANDGGQRRIGSGWGVESAPLDLKEWQSKHDFYHTGRIEKIFEHDGISIAIADVTPAYTNQISGKGTFTHRTRRVEQFWRIFAYDRIDDVVIIFDQVRSTQANFRKRWLLHTIEQPRITENGFVTTVTPNNQPAHGGGQLTAHILLPQDPIIQVIGGKGFEFFVDGKNYDEKGQVAEMARTAKKNAEPGAWRVEVMPSMEAKEDLFLNVLLPTSGQQQPTHKIKLLASGTHPTCEVQGPTRTTQWRFNRGGNDVEIKIQDSMNHGGASRTYHVFAER